MGPGFRHYRSLLRYRILSGDTSMISSVLPIHPEGCSSLEKPLVARQRELLNPSRDANMKHEVHSVSSKPKFKTQKP